MRPDQEIEALEGIIDKLVDFLHHAVSTKRRISGPVKKALSEELRATLDRLQYLRESTEVRKPEISSDAQLLWTLAGGKPEAFVKYLQTFPTRATQALLQDPEQLKQVIEDLAKRMPMGEQPSQDGISPAPMQSSNIWGAKYDHRTGRLMVKFHGGSIYEYSGISPYIWKAFISGDASARTEGKNQYGQWWVGKNPSLGAALNQYIKEGGFRYRRIK